MPTLGIVAGKDLELCRSEGQGLEVKGAPFFDDFGRPECFELVMARTFTLPDSTWDLTAEQVLHRRRCAVERDVRNVQARALVHGDARLSGKPWPTRYRSRTPTIGNVTVGEIYPEFQAVAVPLGRIAPQLQALVRQLT